MEQELHSGRSHGREQVVSKWIECPNCEGHGYELYETDVSLGSNPNREPDFVMVPSDEMCHHCNGHGEGVDWVDCAECGCHICVDEVETAFGEDDDNSHIEYYVCPLCDDFASEVKKNA